jgi:hypothetical protein
MRQRVSVLVMLRQETSSFSNPLRAADGLADEYTHNVIDHAVEYVRGNVHTNGLENFWSLLKRTIRGTYVSVEPFHLFRYLDEQAFRFNERLCDKYGAAPMLVFVAKTAAGGQTLLPA